MARLPALGVLPLRADLRPCRGLGRLAGCGTLVSLRPSSLLRKNFAIGRLIIILASSPYHTCSHLLPTVAFVLRDCSRDGHARWRFSNSQTI